MNADRPLRALATLALAVSASACASVNADDLAQDALAAPGAAFDASRRVAGATYDATLRAARPPQLSPVQSPETLAGTGYDTMPTPAPVAYEPAAPNSLWRSGSRSFFNDQRASTIGDILTVAIEINDSAEVSNSSSRSRNGSSSAGVSNFFGLEETVGGLFGSAFDPATMVAADSSSDHSGTGAINREEKIELTVAAVIVDRLPNGNLVIAGRQEVRINGELRELTVSGIIRPEDITSDNTINHTQIAEARISYGGRGQISAVQRPNWGQRVADSITPW
jgi:flagellar L-ring protein precursor FlgH